VTRLLPPKPALHPHERVVPPRIRRRSLAIVVALAVTLVACGDDDTADTAQPDRDVEATDDQATVERWCGLIEEWAELPGRVQEARDQGMSGLELSNLQRARELFDEVPANSPRSIRDDLRVVTQIPPDAVRIEDADQRSDAVAVLDTYVANECGLRFTFADRDWSGSQ